MDAEITLEQLLRMQITSEDKDGNPVEVIPEFIVVSSVLLDGRVHMMIHANGHASHTLDYHVSGNELVPI